MSHKLLLADDSITIQRVIELTFAEEDVHVLAVGDGKHAIDRVQSDRPDIVLADVGMPERDGYEVAAFIKGNPQLSHIPVLLLTGAFEPIDEARARAVGCDGVLVKPFEPQMVINRVKDLLAGRRSGSTGPQPPVAAAAEPADTDVQTGAPGSSTPGPDSARQGDSLEDYFDRLDAAFATLGSDAPPSSQPRTVPASVPVPVAAAASAAGSRPATMEDFASWDPDLAGDARRPAHVMPATAQASHAAPGTSLPPAPVPVAVTPPPHPVPQAAVAPELPAPPPPDVAPPPAPPLPQISLAEAFAALLAAEHGHAITLSPRSGAPAPDAVEEIVRRVLDRLREEDVRQTVVEVAERLVREEIDRIKRVNG